MSMGSVVKANVDSIHEIAHNIQGVTSTFESMHVVMACLMLSLRIQRPSINSEQLSKGIQGASEWIAMYLSGLDLDPSGHMTDIPKERMH